MSESTNEEVRIVGISGSLRKASFNTALLTILAEKSASSINIQVVTLNDIPLYNEDLDTATGVSAVNALKRLISSCDGVLISTPEYNHGIPGVLKNTLDWLSRPVSESCLKISLFRSSVPRRHSPGGCARSISCERP
jgi:chromate reductase